MRRLLLVAVSVVLTVALASPAVAVPTADHAIADDAATAVHPIVFPVIGATSYEPSFGACRDVGCSRSHEGTDVFAPKLSPLVATRDATVVVLVTDPDVGGIYGNNVVIEDDDGWTHHYVHLNNDTPGTDDGANPPEWIVAPGVEVGARVTAGQLLGWIGDSGNAEHEGAQLHFELHEPDDGIIDPYRSLRAAPVLAAPVDPRGDDARVVDRLSQDLRNRDAGDIELAVALDRLGRGRSVEAVQPFLRSPEWSTRYVTDLYRSALGRNPDGAGLDFWVAALVGGVPAHEVAAAIYAGDEYFAAAGHTVDAWIDRLYRDLLGRAADDPGRAYWRDQIDAGVGRTAVATAVRDSAESLRTRVATWYGVLLDRAPERPAADHWSRLLDGSDDDRLVAALALSDEYRQRALRL